MTAIKVLVTGAAGQIAYNLSNMIAKGNMFGKDQKVILHLLDIPGMEKALKGVEMELQDCAYDTLEKIVTTTDVSVAFKDIDVALMVGAMPRKQGMERKDLLAANVKIFKDQGKALDQHAKKTVKVLVVGNPANTNCLMMSHYAPSIPKTNFSALTRLDHNRAVFQVANKCGVNNNDVKNVIIWGNHSNTQFPDIHHASVNVGGKTVKAMDVIKDEKWMKEEFTPLIQTRGAAVIAARNLSSAVSAASAIVDHMASWWMGTKDDEWVSMAVYSDGTHYNAPKDVIFSFPVKIKNKEYQIVDGLPMNEWSKEKFAKTAKELEDERNTAMAS